MCTSTKVQKICWKKFLEHFLIMGISKSLQLSFTNNIFLNFQHQKQFKSWKIFNRPIDQTVLKKFEKLIKVYLYDKFISPWMNIGKMSGNRFMFVLNILCRHSKPQNELKFEGGKNVFTLFSHVQKIAEMCTSSAVCTFCV